MAEGTSIDENITPLAQTTVNQPDLSGITFAVTSLPISVSEALTTDSDSRLKEQYEAENQASQIHKDIHTNDTLPQPTEDQTSPKSPKITIPLSTLSNIATAQTNDASSNPIVDMQQLQAFLMALQAPITNNATITTPESNIQVTATFESNTLDNLQHISSVGNSNIVADVSQLQGGVSMNTTNVMQIQQMLADYTQAVSISTMDNQLQNQESTLAQAVTPKESTAQAEMIAVEVLTQSVSDEGQHATYPPQTDPASSTTTETPNVINLVQAQVMNGSQFYSLQINGQTLPFTTLQLPLSQAGDLNQAAPVGLTVQTEGLPSSAGMTTLNDTASKLQMPMSPAKEGWEINSGKFSEGKGKYTCEICGKVYVRSWSYYGHMREHAAGEKGPSCDICGKTFSYESNLKQHMLTHTGMKPYKCEICDKSFNNASSLRIHSLSHSEEKPYLCDVEGCGKSFSNPSSLRVHQRVHQTEKPYKCPQPGCNLAFKTSSELSRHSFRHSGAKPHKCNICDKSFVRYDDLKRHHFIHTGEKQFKCDQCDFACIQSFDLVKHKYTHGGQKPYKCVHCSKDFTRPARLREHMRQHTGEKPFKCTQCGKAFSQMTSLKSHLLSHAGTKPYKCELCDKSYTTAADLRSHMNNHTGKRPYKCDICSKDFISAKTLKRHAIVHSGEKPFECEYCNRKFARASDLKVHLPVHSEDKPFKCDSCDKMFTRYSTLKEHSRTHTGEFPFKCEHCDKIFNHRSHLNVHLRTHTGEKPFKCNLCDKEFARKSSLRYHARVHLLGEPLGQVGRPNKSLVEGDYEDFSPAESIESHGMEVDIGNSDDLESIETISTPGKRKRDESVDYSSAEELLQKRLASEEEVLVNVAERMAATSVVISDGDKLQIKTEDNQLYIDANNSLILTHINENDLPISSTASATLITVDSSRLQENEEGQVVSTLMQLQNLDETTERLSNTQINTPGCISIPIANSPTRTIVLEDDGNYETSTERSTSITENYNAENS